MNTDDSRWKRGRATDGAEDVVLVGGVPNGDGTGANIVGKGVGITSSGERLDFSELDADPLGLDARGRCSHFDSLSKNTGSDWVQTEPGRATRTPLTAAWGLSWPGGMPG